MLTSRQAAKKLGLDAKTLSRYIASGKVPKPRIINIGGFLIHSWTETEIERVRKLLPKIKNGRKTRYQKKNKTKPQPRAAAPHKKKNPAS